MSQVLFKAKHVNRWHIPFFYLSVFFLFVASTAVLFFSPAIDLQVELLFYNKMLGFYLRDTWWAEFVYYAIPFVSFIIFSGLVLLLSLNICRKKTYVISNRAIIYLLLVLLLGPGLIINGVLKHAFERSRPVEIVNFGGYAQFASPSLAYIPKVFQQHRQIEAQHPHSLKDAGYKKLEHNRSFPSGHASIGFYFMAVALLSKRWKKTLFSLSILLGFFVGYVRIVQGGHFLSDVVFSGLVVFLVSTLLYYFIMVRQVFLSSEILNRFLKSKTYEKHC